MLHELKKLINESDMNCTATFILGTLYCYTNDVLVVVSENSSTSLIYGIRSSDDVLVEGVISDLDSVFNVLLGLFSQL